MRGQNLLLARRLVEAGIPFVNVYDFRQQGQNWDAHFKNFNQHKTHLLPIADQSLSTLIDDLDERGLLDSTLVVAMGEFGRTPKINADGGRDHWPDCYTVLLAGGGIRGGSVYGSSDRLGAFPATDPVTPADLAATIFWRFGINPATEVHDLTGRPHRLSDGQPVQAIFCLRRHPSFRQVRSSSDGNFVSIKASDGSSGVKYSSVSEFAVDSFLRASVPHALQSIAERSARPQFE